MSNSIPPKDISSTEFGSFSREFDFFSSQKTFCDLTSAKKALSYPGKTLQELCEKFGLPNISIFIRGWLLLFNDLFNYDIDRKLSKNQIEFLANQIIFSYSELKLPEIYLILNRIVQSYYDFFKYGIDASSILRCFKLYTSERMNILNKVDQSTFYTIQQRASFILKGVLENCSNSSLKV